MEPSDTPLDVRAAGRLVTRRMHAMCAGGVAFPAIAWTALGTDLLPYCTGIGIVITLVAVPMAIRSFDFVTMSGEVCRAFHVRGIGAVLHFWALRLHDDALLPMDKALAHPDFRPKRVFLGIPIVWTSGLLIYMLLRGLLLLWPIMVEHG